MNIIWLFQVKHLEVRNNKVDDIDVDIFLMWIIYYIIKFFSHLKIAIFIIGI